MKELSSHTPDELLGLMKREADQGETGYLLSEVIQEYLERTSTDLGWMGMDETIGRVVMAAAYGDEATQPDDFSNVQQLAQGITSAVYSRAMKDCAAFLGVEDWADLESSVLDFAAHRNYGRDGKVEPAGRYTQLLADIKSMNGI